MGGSICNLFTTGEIRRQLIDLGTNTELLNKLVIIQGYIDLKTDIVEIIRGGRDYSIPYNNFSTIWDTRNNYISSMKPLFKHFSISNTWYTVLFGNDCWYKKCTFCNVENNCTQDFIKDSDPDKVFQHIDDLLKEFGSDTIYIDDPYFVFTIQKEDIIKKIRQKGYKVALTTGIHLLLREEYIRKLNQFVDKVFIGLESTSNFALSYINKGYNYPKVLAAADKMLKHLSSHIQLKVFIIQDLIMKDRKDIVQNYLRLIDLKNKLRKGNFKEIRYYPMSLTIFNSPDIISKTKHMKITKSNDFYPSGIWRMYNYLTNNLGLSINPILKKVVLPYQRIDLDGNILPSDFDVVPKDIFADAILR
jgi:radical SAM superfamily enzyme YgiQ (UPF0313 family)